MGLIFLIVIIIAVTAFVMVGAHTKFKLGGEIKKVSKNKFTHSVIGERDHQEPLVEIVGPKLENSVSKVVTALLVKDFTNTEYTHAVMILINDIQVGYLSDDDALKFLKLLNNKNLSEDAAIEVTALIYGDWGGENEIGNFKVSLNLPKNIEESEIK